MESIEPTLRAPLNGDMLVTASLWYVAFLFLIAFWAERRAGQGRAAWLHSPYVYTLSLSVYCTAWTFYGAVGTAARGGLEFLPIYLGPTLVFIGWYFLLRKLIRIGHAQRITSIADLISSRYGKSRSLGVVVTLLAVIGSTPYIALQLKSITLSFSAFAGAVPADAPDGSGRITAFWVAAGLAAFTILFGTRNIDANERHTGVVMAIAVEAVVKLVALLTVGVFVVWGLNDGPASVFAQMPPNLSQIETVFTPRWVTLMFLAGTAVFCLPRMFQIAVVENSSEHQLATAAWAFPLYLALISLFVFPIAIAGLAQFGTDTNPDLFVLTLPLAAGQNGIALLAFLGGLSAATSMVIVATIALSTMVSNHIVLPIWISYRNIQTTGDDVRGVLLTSRRVSIITILILGYLYFTVSEPRALAAIGLISFAGMAQVAPALIGGLYWQGATRVGALAGIGAGFLLWAYTLLLPSFEGGFLLSETVIASGPFGLSVLRPQALFGLEGMDTLVHSMFWSMSVNIGLFVGGSLLSSAQPLERVQARQFVDVFRSPDTAAAPVARNARTSDLYHLASRILGLDAANRLFDVETRAQGKVVGLPEANDRLIQALERELAGSVGAASAHELVGQVAGQWNVTVAGLMRIADETSQLIEAKRRLEHQSSELENTARALRDANAQLKHMDAMKDAFLSKVSHELRTPMTSIRSFAELLSDMDDVSNQDAKRFLRIIRDESVRLTRLLDEILDLSFLESGRATFNIAPVQLAEVIERAIASSEGLIGTSGIRIETVIPDPCISVDTDFDRLAQVIINLISNAVKYGRGTTPQITITTGNDAVGAYIDVSDNGPGVQPDRREEIFEKFARLGEKTIVGSAGLGLPISREIMRNLGGSLVLLPGGPGATFRIGLPTAEMAAAHAASR